ncbi:unnamed protein product [Closterium sp. NIES-54]
MERQRAAQTRTEINTSTEGLHSTVVELIQRAVAREYEALLRSMKENVKEGVDAAMGPAEMEGRLRVILPYDYMETMKKAMVANLQETLADVKSAMAENCKKLASLKAEILVAVDEKLSWRIDVGQVPYVPPIFTNTIAGRGLGQQPNPMHGPHFLQNFASDTSLDAALAAAANMVERSGFTSEEGRLETDTHTERGTKMVNAVDNAEDHHPSFEVEGRRVEAGERDRRVELQTAAKKRRVEYVIPTAGTPTLTLVPFPTHAIHLTQLGHTCQPGLASPNHLAASTVMLTNFSTPKTRAVALEMAEARQKRLEEATRERAEAERRQREMELEEKRVEDERACLVMEDE